MHFCAVVGQILWGEPSVGRSFEETWNGRGWTALDNHDASLGPAGDMEMTGVSCPSVRDCLAVGSDDAADAVLSARWNGRRWMYDKVVHETADVVPTPQATSCTRSGACLVVGDVADTVWYPQGAELIPASTGLPSPSEKQFSAVACPGPGFCLAVSSAGSDPQSGDPISGFAAVG